MAATQQSHHRPPRCTWRKLRSSVSLHRQRRTVFVRCDHDLSMLSNAIEGVLLRPAHEKDLELPSATGKEHFVQFVSGGNILDLKEKYHIKKMKSLEFASFRVKAFRHDKAVIQTSMYFMSVGKAWSKATKLLTAFPANLLAIDFTTNTHYLKKPFPNISILRKPSPYCQAIAPEHYLKSTLFHSFHATTTYISPVTNLTSTRL